MTLRFLDGIESDFQLMELMNHSDVLTANDMVDHFTAVQSSHEMIGINLAGHTDLFLNTHEYLNKVAEMDEIDTVIKAYQLYLEQTQAQGLEALLSVTRAWRDGGKGFVEIDCQIVNQDGKVTTPGGVVAELPLRAGAGGVR